LKFQKYTGYAALSFSASTTLTFNLKISLPVTADVSSLSFNFECCTVFHFQVNSGHRTCSPV